MTKLTKRQSRASGAHTPAGLKGQQVQLDESLGCYQPAAANWCYRAGWTRDGVLVVTRFGEIQ